MVNSELQQAKWEVNASFGMLLRTMIVISVGYTSFIIGFKIRNFNYLVGIILDLEHKIKHNDSIWPYFELCKLRNS